MHQVRYYYKKNSHCPLETGYDLHKIVISTMFQLLPFLFSHRSWRSFTSLHTTNGWVAMWGLGLLHYIMFMTHYIFGHSTMFMAPKLTPDMNLCERRANKIVCN